MMEGRLFDALGKWVKVPGWLWTVIFCEVHLSTMVSFSDKVRALEI